MTYAQVALAIGRPAAVRAVGNALNKNPFAPQVPCHRVVKSDGSLGGFAHGPRAKQALLKNEGVVY
jgi:O-6-methylguanine DNA methyltransferase